MHMLKKKNRFLLLLTLTVLFMVVLKSAFAYRVSSVPFSVYFPANSQLAFQNADRFVWILVSSGTMNSSVATCGVDAGGGFYYFVANESVTLTITYNVTNVKVNGAVIVSGASRSFVQTDSVKIEWAETIKPLLPMMFMFGMIGMVSLFAGPLYVTYNVKKKNISQNVFYTGIMLTSIGIALVLAWLW